MRCRRALRELRGRIEELEHTDEALAKQRAATAPRRVLRARRRRGLQRGRPPMLPPGPHRATDASSTEQAVYSQAFDALKAGSYSIAITGFKDFLGTYRQARSPKTRSTGSARRIT